MIQNIHLLEKSLIISLDPHIDVVILNVAVPYLVMVLYLMRLMYNSVQMDVGKLCLTTLANTGYKGLLFID